MREETTLTRPEASAAGGQTDRAGFLSVNPDQQSQRPENLAGPDANDTNLPAHSPVAQTQEDTALNGSLEILKEMAFNLLQEVKALGGGPTADIARGVDFYEEVRRFETHLICRALEITDGHQSRAARLLNLKITTLNSIIKRYGIEPHAAPKVENGTAENNAAEDAPPAAGFKEAADASDDAATHGAPDAARHAVNGREAASVPQTRAA